jgi:signal transduction histidine kinase
MSEPTIESLSNRILAAAIDLWNRRASATGSFCSAVSDQELADWEGQKLEEFLGALKKLFPLWPNIEQPVEPSVEPTVPTGLLEGLRDIYRKISDPRLGLGAETRFQGEFESREARDVSVLRESLHRAISLLSTCGSVTQAIEDSARRQVYELAYGLTHEINNPLGNIAARAQLLLSKSSDPMDRKALATILDQSMRAHELLAEMMRVVQPRLVERTETDLRALAKLQFDRMANLADEKKLSWEWVEAQGLQAASEAHTNTNRTTSNRTTSNHTKSQHIKSQKIENRYRSVVCGQGVQEAIRLVAQNAIEATRRRDSIRWSVVREGDFVKITISDTGPGVSPQAAQRAFDLYYSGREAGRGLGVSLAAVRRFVEENAGQIHWSSEAGIGTSVRMEFPAI